MLYGKGLDKGRIGGALNELYYFFFSSFSFLLVSCLQFRDIQCYLS